MIKGFFENLEDGSDQLCIYLCRKKSTENQTNQLRNSILCLFGVL